MLSRLLPSLPVCFWVSTHLLPGVRLNACILLTEPIDGGQRVLPLDLPLCHCIQLHLQRPCCYNQRLPLLIESRVQRSLSPGCRVLRRLQRCCPRCRVCAGSRQRLCLG